MSIPGCNILIAGDGTAKLSDFGAAGRLQQEDTMHNEFRSSHGTPAFMAPEVSVRTRLLTAHALVGRFSSIVLFVAALCLILFLLFDLHLT